MQCRCLAFGMDLAERYSHDRYVFREKFFKIFGNRFHIYDPGDELVLYARMKGLKIREDLRLFTSEAMDEEVLRIQTKSLFDISGTYGIYDPVADQTLGALKRRGLKSFFKDEWLILDAEGEEVGVIKEDSAIKAALRRIHEATALLIKQSYHVEMDGERVAQISRGFNPLVKRTFLDLSADTQHRLDPRVALAATLLLAAVEVRQ